MNQTYLLKLRQVGIWLLLIMVLVGCNSWTPTERSYAKTEIYVNHLGFMPAGAKYFVIAEPQDQDFQIIDRWDHEVVFRGHLKKVSGDFATEYVGCFSDLHKEGTYWIQSFRFKFIFINFPKNSVIPFKTGLKLFNLQYKYSQISILWQ